jgi:hypothetical protein
MEYKVRIIGRNFNYPTKEKSKDREKEEAVEGIKSELIR